MIAGNFTAMGKWSDFGTALTWALERRHSDSPALHDALGTMTAGQALDLTYRLARTLIDFGHGPGQVAALAGAMSTRMYLLSHAVELTGGARLELPAGLAAEHQARLIAETGATLLVADPETMSSTATRAARQVPGLRVLALGQAPGAEDLLREAARRPVAALPSRARHGDAGRITLTRGSTGSAKPVLRRFRAADPAMAGWFTKILSREGGPVRLLKAGPFGGMGPGLANAALAAGGEFASRASFDPAQVVPLMATLGVTHLFCSPHELRRLLDSPGLDAADLPDLRHVCSATAATWPALLKRAAGRLGPVVYPCYGQSEAGMITVLEPEHYAGGDLAIMRSCGLPVPGVSVEIRGAYGMRLGPGERGEIWVRTPVAMDEYWQRPAATARVLRDGWVNTGDIGFRDADGFLTVLGRSRDAIAVPGGNLFPPA